MRETRDLEFKLEVSDSFLKTVSAFANYGGGRILFGVDDGGNSVGLSDSDEAALRIEGKINDTITPQPDYRIDISPKTHVLTLTVNEGESKPYYYRSRAYKRNDSSTVETDRLELSRLILEGSHRTFDEIPAKNQQLSFNTLKRWLLEKMDVAEIDADILKTLELCDPKGCCNNAAAIFSDQNDFPGIDMAVFGDSINIIRQRKTVSGVSLLQQYEAAVQMWRDHCAYEQITGALREEVELIPQQAFREAVANALAHRTWDVNAHIRISFHRDHVEVVSPGGLPAEMSKKEYLKGRVSILRNPILGNLMFRLHIIERFGTGVTRIRECYRGSIHQPVFDIGQNSICVILPIHSARLLIDADEQAIYESLSSSLPRSTPQIAQAAGFGETKTRALLQKMVSGGVIRHVGTGRGSKYLRQS